MNHPKLQAWAAVARFLVFPSRHTERMSEHTSQEEDRFHPLLRLECQDGETRFLILRTKLKVVC